MLPGRRLGAGGWTEVELAALADGFQPAGQPLVPAKRAAGQQEKGQKEAVPEEVGNTAADIALFPEDRPVLFFRPAPLA